MRWNTSLSRQEDSTFAILESKMTEVLHQQFLVPGDLAPVQLSIREIEWRRRKIQKGLIPPEMRQVGGCVGLRTLKRHIEPKYMLCYCTMVTLARTPTRGMYRLHEMALLQECYQKPSFTSSAATNLRVVCCTDMSCNNIEGANPQQLKAVEPNTRNHYALEVKLCPDDMYVLFECWSR